MKTEINSLGTLWNKQMYRIMSNSHESSANAKKGLSLLRILLFCKPTCAPAKLASGAGARVTAVRRALAREVTMT